MTEVNSAPETVLDSNQAALQASNATSLLAPAPSSFIYASALLTVPSQCPLPERMRRAQGNSTQPAVSNTLPSSRYWIPLSEVPRSGQSLVVLAIPTLTTSEFPCYSYDNISSVGTVLPAYR